ncbi:hypothetical protein P3T73_03050 [Kiritimatiellota bacterium B12222]|nr:hypothetical protein P3T73_03050 [Kiritimatiellota bacterium B12222]
MTFLETHANIIGTLALVSFFFLIASILLIPWMINRLPRDYFHNPHHLPLESLRHRPVLRISFLLIKNAFGVILGLAGFAMLVLPGQGLLTLLVAIILLDFPGKFALKQKCISVAAIRKPINAIRKKWHKEPFQP